MMSTLSFKNLSPWYYAIILFAVLMMIIIATAGYNQSLFLILNNFFYFKPEAFWINVTLFGDAGMVMILMLPLVGRRPEVIWIGFITAILATITVQLLKPYIDLPRPPSVLASDTFHTMGNIFGSKTFPSGHTTAAFALAGVIALNSFSNTTRVLVLIFAFMIGLSRIAVGAHWPIDVLAGMVIGWTCAIAGVWLARYLPGTSRGVQMVTSFILVATVIYLVFFHHDGDKEARFMEITVPLICLALSLRGLQSVYFPGSIRSNE